MDTTPGDVLTEGFLWKYSPNSVAPSNHSWKARYFILKSHYLLYWKKRQHAVQSPNNPHCLIDLEGSTIEKVSLVEGKAPQFPHCLRVTTALINHGSFLTYHFCLQEEDLFRNWFNCLRRALGQPELPPSPPSHPKTTHTRSLSTGGGLGAIQRQPLQTLSSSPTSILSTSSPSSSSSYYSGPSGKLGVDTVRHFQPIQIQDEDLDALLNNSETTNPTQSLIPSISTPEEPNLAILSSSPSSSLSSSSETKPDSSTSHIIDSTTPPPTVEPSSAPTPSDSQPSEPSPTPLSDSTTSVDAADPASTPTEVASPPSLESARISTSTEPSSTSASTPSSSLTTASSANPDSSVSSVSTPSDTVKTPAMTKKEEIQSEIARARMRVLQLEKSNKLTPPSTIASRFPVKVPPPETDSGLFTSRNAIILLFVLILYWYLF